jgi:SH3-like domain-containing protein
VGKYYPVDVVKKAGKWYQIADFEGDRGWMHKSLLKKIPSVIVKATLVNVREGPGKNFKVVFQAEKGVSMRLMERKKSWMKVKHADGDVGWIHKSLVWGH